MFDLDAHRAMNRELERRRRQRGILRGDTDGIEIAIVLCLLFSYAYVLHVWTSRPGEEYFNHLLKQRMAQQQQAINEAAGQRASLFFVKFVKGIHFPSLCQKCAKTKKKKQKLIEFLHVAQSYLHLSLHSEFSLHFSPHSSPSLLSRAVDRRGSAADTMTHTIKEDDGSPHTEAISTSGETPPLTLEVSTAVADDTDCITAIEKNPLKTTAQSVPTLKLAALRAIREVIRDQLANGTIALILPQIVPVLIETAQKTLGERRADEFAAASDCINALMREPRHLIVNRTQWSGLLYHGITTHVILLSMKSDIEQCELAAVEKLLSTFCALTKEFHVDILKRGYDEAIPVLVDLVRQNRSETLRTLAFHSIARFGYAVRMRRFRADFIEVFRCFVNGNPVQIMSNLILDFCLGCVDNKANVVIRKVCDSDYCSSCACPPCWCCECLARSFLESAPSVDQEAACPTCRANYCVHDVAIVSDDEKSEA